MEEWRKRSNYIEKKVRVTNNARIVEVKIYNLEEDGCFMIRTNNEIFGSIIFSD